MKKMQIFRKVDKNDGPMLAISGPKFTKFWDDTGDPRSFQRRLLIVSINFHARDIHTLSCH